MMTFKQFLNEELWDSDGKGTPMFNKKPSDGQPFAQFARPGKPKGASMGGGMPLRMMRKRMKK